MSAGLHTLRSSFYELVRALEAVAPNAPRVGEDGPPSKEVARFRGHASLAFAPRDVHSIDLEQRKDGHRQAVFTMAFSTLFGPDSPLPDHDTVRILRDDDTRARDLLDILNHRIVSLRYRAWARPRPYAAGSAWHQTSLGKVLHALVDPSGMDPGGSVSFRAPHLRFLGPRSAAGLTARVRTRVGAEVDVQQCVPQSITIPVDQRCRLGRQASTLGGDIVLGNTAWDATGRFRVAIGPVSKELFDAFAPGGDLHRDVSELIQSWLVEPLDWSIEVRLSEQHASSARLGTTQGCRLGVDTWLGRPTAGTVTTDLRPFSP